MQYSIEWHNPNNDEGDTYLYDTEEEARAAYHRHIHNFKTDPNYTSGGYKDITIDLICPKGTYLESRFIDEW
jgi:5,10-methylenetetrahydrofolate reductase